LLKHDRIEEAPEIYAQAAPFLEKHVGDASTRLKLWEELFQTNLDLGHRLAKRGNVEKAEAAFEQAANIHDRLKKEFSAGEAPTWRLARGLALAGPALRTAGKTSDADRFSQRALELSSQFESGSQPWEAWHARGIAHAGLSQWDKALADQTKALELQPESDQSLSRRGEVHLALKQWDSAIADFSKAIALNPGYPGAWHFRGYAHANLSQWDSALADLSSAVELGAVNWVVWSRRGDVYCAVKQWEKALADYDTAIEKGAANPTLWISKAAAHAQLGQADKAITDLQQAVARGFRDASLLTKRDDLAPLRSLADFKKLVEVLEATKK
jgi:tetratricopeptide (TPR) repeat protein